jgi:Zn-finger nucleic acid-binding protein
MTCPRCLRPLEVRHFKSAVIHSCPSCGGVWLGTEQTDTVFKRMPGGAALVSASNQAVQRSEKQRPTTDGTAQCPVGGEEMILCEAEGIRIDRCPHHGTWFDAHELRRIANAEANRERREQGAQEQTPAESRGSWWKRNASSSDDKPDLGDWIEGFFDALYEADRRR